jgi:hypothetical protein
MTQIDTFSTIVSTQNHQPSHRLDADGEKVQILAHHEEVKGMS